MLTVIKRPLGPTTAGRAKIGDTLWNSPYGGATRTVHPVNGRRGMIPMPTDVKFLNAIAAVQPSRRVVSSLLAPALVESFFVGVPASR